MADKPKVADYECQRCNEFYQVGIIDFTFPRFRVSMPECFLWLPGFRVSMFE